MTFKECILVAAMGVFVLISDARADCTEDNWDAYKVGKALQQGLSRDALIAHLDASRAELTAERMEKIRGWIDEVYALQPQDAEVWWKAHHKECPKEDEA